MITPTNPTLVSNMRNAYIHHNQEQNKKKEIERKKKEKFEVKVKEIITTKT